MATEEVEGSSVTGAELYSQRPFHDAYTQDRANVYEMQEYVNFTGDASLLFSVKASNDVHIGFFTGSQNYAEMYEIVLGGWGNTQSVIRRANQGSSLTVASTHGINNSNEYRDFWITVAEGEVRVGRGLAFGVDVIMSVQDPNPLDIRHLGIMTGWGSEGQWKIYELQDQLNLVWIPVESGITYDEAVQICQERNGLLATQAQYFPAGTVNGGLNRASGDWGDMDDDTQDRWAPIRDTPNDWVQTRFFGNKRNSVGKTHIECGFGPPRWGTTGSQYTTSILCEIQESEDDNWQQTINKYVGRGCTVNDDVKSTLHGRVTAVSTGPGYFHVQLNSVDVWWDFPLECTHMFEEFNRARERGRAVTFTSGKEKWDNGLMVSHMWVGYGQGGFAGSIIK